MLVDVNVAVCVAVSVAAGVCLFESVRRRGLLDPDIVARIRRDVDAGETTNLYPMMWTLMIFELWCRAVLDPAGQRTLAGQAAETR